MTQTPYYDDPSFNYKKYWEERTYENQADRIALETLIGLIPLKNSLLELGVGFGRLTPIYCRKFNRCYLLDPSKKMLTSAKKLLSSQNLIFKNGFAEEIPYEDNKFNSVLLIRTFHHLKNPQQVIKEINRVLKPEGYLILEFANKMHLKAKIKALLTFNLNFLFSPKPKHIGKKVPGCIPFLNYHPKEVKKMIESNDFVIKKTISVSNFRSSSLKKTLPLNFLIFLEKIFQKLPVWFYWGPSIYFLCQKQSHS